MQKRTSYFLGFLIILFLGSSIVLGGDSGVCPLPSTSDQTVLSSPAEPDIDPIENFTIQRNCVLLELFAGTW
jgi:hypothetical protein